MCLRLIQTTKLGLTTGLLTAALLWAGSARADSCYGGGYRPPEKKDAGNQDVAMKSPSPAKRQLGLGFLAAASVGTVWLSFRRRDGNQDK
jgi:hypothetical protein